MLLLGLKVDGGGDFNMSQVYLTSEQLSLFLKIIKERSLFKINKNNIIFDEQRRDIIIDEISNYFSLKGLNKDGEPNNLGIEVEMLLDKFV